MKHLAVFILLGSFFIFARPALSQTFDYTKAYEDYTFNFDLYQKAFNEFDLARSQYLQSKTLTAQGKAQEATYKMLVSRDEVVKTYLTALRLKLAESPGVKKDQRENFYTILDQNVAWFNTHKLGLSSAATLEDQTKDSDEARDRFTSITPTIYKILVAIPTGKIDSLQDIINKSVSELKAKIIEIRAAGDHNTDVSERWILEVENRLARSEDKQSDAQMLLLKLKDQEKGNADIYNQAISRLQESLQYIKEANSYLKEIIKQIKTQD